MAQIAPYGSWRSPITAAMLVTKQVSLSWPQIDGADLYWIEGRPQEGGRNVLVRRTADGTISDVTPTGMNVRTLVHEYGGLSHVIDQGEVFFVEFSDQTLYRQRPGEAPVALGTPAGLRFAEMVVDRARNRLIAIGEDHRGDGEAQNYLVAVDLASGATTPLLTGRDFVAAPRLSPDGAWLAWLAWDHPNMPWDAAELWVAPVLADGSLGTARRLAGGPNDSCFQPEWAADSSLLVVAERSGWWNLYRLDLNGNATPLYPIEAEFGQPLWQPGMRTYLPLTDGSVLAAFCQHSRWQMALIHRDGRTEPIDLPVSVINIVNGAGERALIIGSSPTMPATLFLLDLADRSLTPIRQSGELPVEPVYLSLPEVISFPSAGGRTAYGIFYPPHNPDFVAPAGELPPLLVMIHGGPTAAAYPTLRLSIQYWTSRGIGVLDVNYGGSTGFGRTYRELLDGQWGIVDVEDCVASAQFLVANGKADPARLLITGGSAGGFTVLAALAFHHTFRAGASHFGVADLAALARDTHKFESRYLDRLIGPYPERADLYQARSPLYHAHQITCPVIFFQGLEDKVVPPAQSEAMYEALRARGIRTEYVPFAGEQHGFRKAENIITAIKRELAFYGEVLGFTPAV
ncbi:S9 family peptidase [Chloroflexus sp.]|uniref:S9 family peptidase n=1 Tax=Chloroflexus sp. TaxID=1904827 RepID=UPI002ACEF226|nr:S9 family peptidase [Chloroflexus sp.]